MQNTETPLRLVFLGNSLTAAYGLDPAEGFVALLEEKMNRARLPVRVLNAGLSGETTQGGRQRLAYLLKNEFDLLVIELGINDAFQGIPPAAIKSNLLEIIDRTRREMPKAHILLIGLRPEEVMAPPQAEAFQRLFAEIREEAGVPLVPDLLAGATKRGPYLLPDGLHPNAAGHQLMAHSVWKVLKPELKKMARGR